MLMLNHHVSLAAAAAVLPAASRGRNAMKKAMMGSMTDSVIQKVSCPCLVVKPQVRPSQHMAQQWRQLQRYRYALSRHLNPMPARHHQHLVLRKPSFLCV